MIRDGEKTKPIQSQTKPNSYASMVFMLIAEKIGASVSGLLGPGRKNRIKNVELRM